MPRSVDVIFNSLGEHVLQVSLVIKLQLQCRHLQHSE